MAQATPVSEDDLQRRAAKEFAASLGPRRRGAGAPVRTLFVSNEDVDRPPLARLLSGTSSGGGGGRGGHVRAKLYVSLLWVAAKHPYTISKRPARAWAALLGLPDVETSGVRRVQQALRDLQDRKFIELEDRGGQPSLITVLSETGTGRAFVPAPEAYNEAQVKKKAPHILARHQYFRVPSALWTEGHISQLSGPGFAMLLALLSEVRGQAPDQGVWFSPDRAKARFGFAASTRREGLDQLRDLGLVHTTTRSVSERGTYIDFARRRNVHVVTLEPSVATE